MRFAIVVRKGHETYNKVDEVAEQLRQRTLAVRAFDGNGMMLSCALAEGQDLAVVIDKLFRQSTRENRWKRSFRASWSKRSPLG